MPTVRTVRAQYDAANLEAARIILNDPAKYPEGSGAAQWATLVLKRLTRPKDEEAGLMAR